MPLPSTTGYLLLAAAVFAATFACFLLRRRLLNIIARWLHDAQSQQRWDAMPDRIVLLRHGEAEHNLNHGELLIRDNPCRRPDNLCELTPRGREQSSAAGQRLADLLGKGSQISIVCSPFERTQQTLYCVQRKLDDCGIAQRYIHIDPRVREQEFGNFQEREHMLEHRRTAQEVGRFWYRRPTGESGADVYDRACQFWDAFYQGSLDIKKTLLSPAAGRADDAMLIVSHGLTIRILCMAHFNWSPQTFDAVYNPGNCDMWVLRKHPTERRYEFAPAECHPPGLPWATRQVELVMRDGRARPYTLVDYLSLPQPRTCHPEAALRHLIEGHGHNLDPCRVTCSGIKERCEFIENIRYRVVDIDEREVTAIDWWCGKISQDGKGLRHKDFGGANRVG